MNESSPGGKNRPAMIEAIGLSKHYGHFAAVADVSFTVPEMR